MANTRKPIKRKKINRRVVRQTRELTKMDTHFITLHEAFTAAKRAGFSESVALYLMDSPASMPDWVVGEDGIIPTIPTPEEDED